MAGNTLYDLLCAQIGLATKSSLFGSAPKNPFSYSPVTDYTISNSQAPELSIQTVKYVNPDTSNTIVGVGWQFRLVIESPYKYNPDYSGVVSFETDWGSSQKGFTSYMCVKQQQSSATSYSIVQPEQTNSNVISSNPVVKVEPEQTNSNVISSNPEVKVEPEQTNSKVYPRNPRGSGIDGQSDNSQPSVNPSSSSGNSRGSGMNGQSDNSQPSVNPQGSSGSFNYQPGSSTDSNNIGLTGNLKGKSLTTGTQLFDFSCDGLRLDNFLISVSKNNQGGATFTQYGYAPLKIGGQFSFVARIKIQIPTQSIPIFSKNLSSIYMILDTLDATASLTLSCVAAALIVLAF